MKLFRKAAVAAAIVAGALAFAPAAAQAHSSGGSVTTRTATCTQYPQAGTSGTQVGLVNLGNLNLSALNNPALAVLGIAGTSVTCTNS